MSHTELIKRAFTITWRTRPLWLFGFLLALCSGGGGGGGGSPGPPSSGFEDYYNDIPSTVPQIDVQMILAAIAVLICLALILALIGVVVRAVTRTALIKMVRQVDETEAVTIGQGWRMGWSGAAWRLWLVGLVIGIPMFIVTIGLVLLAMSPLLLMITGETGPMVAGIMLTILAFLLVMAVLMVIGAIISPILELTWRHTVLDGFGVFDSFGRTFKLINRNLKDVVIVWLLMFGVGLLWVMLVFIILLPVSLIAALILGGIPAAAVYFISGSGIGAAIDGVPLGFIALIVVITFGSGLYLIFQSSVWTLAYLGLQKLDVSRSLGISDSDVPPNIASTHAEI